MLAIICQSAVASLLDSDGLRTKLQAIADANPQALSCACDGGRYPIDFVSSPELCAILKRSPFLTTRLMSRSIFGIVRSKPLPGRLLRRLITENRFAAFDEQDGYWPLEALCAFGDPRPDVIQLLFDANPRALHRAVGAGCLDLLCGNSSSVPTLAAVKLL